MRVTEIIGVGVLVTLAVFFFIAACYALGALFLTWAWNLVAPLFWTGAPKLTFWLSVAVLVLLGVIRGLLTVRVNKVE